MPDLVDAQRDAVVRNAIVGDRIGRLAENAQNAVAAAIVPRLYETWGDSGSQIRLVDPSRRLLCAAV
jgi:hypothetical protein